MISKIKRTILYIVLFCSLTKVRAQENPVKITYNANVNKSIDFSFEKKDPGTHTVIVTFTNLTNSSSSDKQVLSINGYSGRLFTLTPENANRSISFSYSYSSIRGKLDPKYKAEFIYILPYKRGTKVKVAEAGFVGAKYFGNTTPDDWKVYRFYSPSEDTVTSVRKGIVVEIKDQHDTDMSSDVEYSSKTNEITIEHADGTLARYTGFKKGSIPLKIGQTVYPGTILGVNSNKRGKFSISLAILYLKSNDVESTKQQNLKNSKSLYGFVNPYFYTAGQTNVLLNAGQEYTADDNSEIIKKEFSKKELKQLSK